MPAPVLLGVLIAGLLPGLLPLLQPLGQILLRASQIVVRPSLLCELVGALVLLLLFSSLLVVWLPPPSSIPGRCWDPPLPPEAEAGRALAFEEIAALLPVGFALPTLGQMVSLVFLPFCAWLVEGGRHPALGPQAGRQP